MSTDPILEEMIRRNRIVMDTGVAVEDIPGDISLRSWMPIGMAISIIGARHAWQNDHTLVVYFSRHKLPHHEIKKWCAEHIENDYTITLDWNTCEYTVHFLSDAAAVAFKLRWLV